MPLELVFLGTASGFPTPNRNHSSLLIQSEGISCLVDAGEPCSRACVTGDLTITETDAILITHGHADHIGGLPMLVQTAWLSQRAKPLPIYLPGELVEPLQKWLEAVYLGEGAIPFVLEFNAWNPNEAVSLCGAKVRPFETDHLRYLRERFGDQPGRFKAYGLIFESAGHRIVLSGDLGSPEDLGPALTEPVDLLVCELAHFPPETLLAQLEGRSVKHLVLTHLAGELLGYEREILAQAKMLRSTKTEIATDGLRIALP
jgi:ribonuclease BN (tRNA processing enzyme)